MRGAAIDSHLDHRIAMSFAVAALNADGETEIQDAECVNISLSRLLSGLKQNLFQNLSYAFLGIGRSDAVRLTLYVFRTVRHRHADSGKAQHINIVVRIAKGNDLIRTDIQTGGPLPEGPPLFRSSSWTAPAGNEWKRSYKVLPPG